MANESAADERWLRDPNVRLMLRVKAGEPGRAFGLFGKQPIEMGIDQTRPLGGQFGERAGSRLLGRHSRPPRPSWCTARPDSDGLF